MELVIEGRPELHTEGTVTVELPAYFTVLPGEELEEARAASNRSDLIIAAGRHPKTREIVFMTGDGQMSTIDTTQFGIPAGRVFPKDKGGTLRIELAEFEGFDVEAAWALRVGVSLLNFGSMTDKRGARVTYVDE